MLLGQMRCSVVVLQVIRFRSTLKTFMCSAPQLKVQFISFAITLSCTVHNLELTGAWGYQMYPLSSLCIIAGGVAPSYLLYSVVFLESKSQHRTSARFTSEVLLIMTGGMPDPLTLPRLMSHSLSTCQFMGAGEWGVFHRKAYFS